MDDALSNRRHGRMTASALLAMLLAAVTLVWAWKAVAVKGFGLAALGFGPALAFVVALVGAGLALGLGAALAGRLLER